MCVTNNYYELYRNLLSSTTREQDDDMTFVEEPNRKSRRDSIRSTHINTDINTHPKK